MSGEVVDTYYAFFDFGLKLVRIFDLDCVVEYWNNHPTIYAAHVYRFPFICKYGLYKRMVYEHL